ncbi:MAG: radical SAM protein [candidate division WOR-3 bacterium]|nr:MAG: radical SAM protein [candidate division WOR-3 bacterium]
MKNSGPRHRVRPYWWPPSLILRQAASALAVGAFTRWRRMPQWFLRYGIKCLPGAGGSRGMGCIGFPDHPVWEMTTACNLKCVHCHTTGGAQGSDELTTSEAKELLSELSQFPNFRMMAFTGGEPLMRPDLYELLAYSRSLGFKNTIATNATLIDDCVARRLSDHGVVIAAVSLDGFFAKTHDMVRGLPGSFDSAVEGMRALRRAGILLHINITAMEYNMDQIDKLMDLVEDLDTGILLMYQLVPVGRGRAIEDAALGKAANEWLTRFMARAQSSTNAIMEPVAGPQYWSYLLKRAHISSGMLKYAAETFFHGCSAGRGFVYIKPDGAVWPCPFIEKSCGNVRERSFREIWVKSEIFNELRHREELLKGQCGQCEYRRLCGGCRGRAWASTGDYLAEDPCCFIHDGKV